MPFCCSELFWQAQHLLFLEIIQSLPAQYQPCWVQEVLNILELENDDIFSTTKLVVINGQEFPESDGGVVTPTMREVDSPSSASLLLSFCGFRNLDALIAWPTWLLTYSG